MIAIFADALLMQAQATSPCEGVTIGDPGFADCLNKIMTDAKAKPTTGAVLFRELRKLHGKPQQHAFDGLGYPDDRMRIESRTIYIWKRSEPDDLHCTVKVIVEAGRVIDTDFNGNSGACSYFAKRLGPSFKRP